MIAEVFPEAYDTVGRPTFRPDQRRRRRFPTSFPIGRYFSQPLGNQCQSLEDLRTFLRKCRYVSDEEQFGRANFWMPPEKFERSRKGDCEDFALYAWRQLLSLGYAARFVGGKHSRNGEGHAWVTFQKNGKIYLLEPQLRSLGLRMPRLSTLAYEPYFSVEWDGENAHFYKHERHERHKFTPPAPQIPGLVLEWVYFYTRIILRLAHAIPIRFAKLAYRRLRGKRQS